MPVLLDVRLQRETRGTSDTFPVCSRKIGFEIILSDCVPGRRTSRQHSVAAKLLPLRGVPEFRSAKGPQSLQDSKTPSSERRRNDVALAPRATTCYRAPVPPFTLSPFTSTFLNHPTSSDFCFLHSSRLHRIRGKIVWAIRCKGVTRNARTSSVSSDKATSTEPGVRTKQIGRGRFR